jgi:hypothetical protein
MAKHDTSDKPVKKPAKKPAAAKQSAGGHLGAKAHGQPTTVDTSLPSTRAELLERHAAARTRRNAAPLGSETHRAAIDEIGRIEIRIAAIERDQVPPLG